MRAALVLASLAAFCALGCSGSLAQRAAVSPAPYRSSPASPAATAAPGVTVRPLEVRPPASRYVVVSDRSSLDVYGGDVITGEHRLRVRRWRAYVDTDPVLAIALDVDLTSVEGDLPFVTTIAKNTLLEVDKFPHAFFHATLGRTEGPPDEHVVDGIADLHGVQREVRFTGSLQEEGDGYRFRADFVVPRMAFDIHAGVPFDDFVRNDVRIVVDALATPERVRVEELDDDGLPVVTP